MPPAKGEHIPSELLGVVLAGPMPVMSCPIGLEALSVWTFTPSLDPHSWQPRLPGGQGTPFKRTDSSPQGTVSLPLMPGDPLAEEQFCLFITPFLSGVLVQTEQHLLLSFLPEVVAQAWQAIRLRLQITHSPHLAALSQQIQAFPVVLPDYVRVMQFHRHMLALMPEPVAEAKPEAKGFAQRVADAVAAVEQLANPESIWQPLDPKRKRRTAAATGRGKAKALDLELLQAIAHEVRTPLTTIRTMTRSLMKRKDVTAEALKRLVVIDRECSEQIDRFNLFFRAAELEKTTAQPVSMALIRTPLDQVFAQSIPRWQQQAQQRGMDLQVHLPETMPAVVSDPAMLDQALGSLIERFTRNLTSGSRLSVEVRLAGSQLKVQLHCEGEEHCHPGQHASPFQALGQMLMFQPDTGSLSLNLNATKNLFQALGGKLTVREKPKQGEVLTVYLPLERDPNVLEV